MSKKILVALGGNALLQVGEKGTYEEAQKNAQLAVNGLVKLIEAGNNLVVTHGNGPQVGAIKLQNQIASEKVPEMPLSICGAYSQGYLGYLMAQTFENTFVKSASMKNKRAVAIVTQTVVDPKDPSFQNPTKPIGRFYTKEEADVLIKQGKNVVEDSGRGYRIVVPSPLPIDIVEKEAILELSNKGMVVISTGGGGIPVVPLPEGGFKGIEAVIDKDLGGALLGQLAEADVFMILTDVTNAYIDFRGPNQKALETITVAEAEGYLNAGHFAKGSMGPKITAALNFAKSKKGRIAVVTSLDKVVDALSGKCGTRIVG